MGRRSSGFFLGLVLGAVVGATLAILFAPQEGERTRSLLLEQGAELRSQAKERFNDALAQGRETYGKVKEELSTRYNRAKTGEY